MANLRLSGDGRHFANPFSDYSVAVQAKSLLDAGNQQLAQEWQIKINQCIDKLMIQLDHGLNGDVDEADYSVYTGMAGIALLFFRMFDKIDRRQDMRYLRRAHEIIAPYMDRLKQKRVSFLCGDAGPLAITAVVYHFLNRPHDKDECIRKLMDIAEGAVNNPEISDELLYGRAGCVYALLFVQHYLGKEAVSENVVRKVFDAIKTSGETLSSHKQSRCPLLYRWHHSYYTGAAHGMSGIYFLLMRHEGFNENHDLKDLVKQSTDFLITQRFPSGNYPSSLDKERDELVHWCHGAPGFIHMFIQAYRVYGEERYLDEARSCADVLWNRGLLQKGYGLCHGPAGNGYGFLALFQITQELKYLYRALKFAEWMFAYGTHGCRVSDHPFSLFEGMAGTIYYLVDILHPNEAGFPAFYF